MIKLIIFDLDGVLIESKDIHYESLNKALNVFGQVPITYKEHISEYDGKPTKTKLIMRGINKLLHEKLINRNKKSQLNF